MRDIGKAFRRPPAVPLRDRNGGLPRLSDGVPHGLRCLASPRHALLGENLGKPFLWVIISAPWYKDHGRFLLRLAELEPIDREGRMVERRIEAARFPTLKSLDSFDFKAIPSLNKTLVLERARCEYVERRENVIAPGN